jgi:hypothetical protein
MHMYASAPRTRQGCHQAVQSGRGRRCGCAGDCASCPIRHRLLSKLRQGKLLRGSHPHGEHGGLRLTGRRVGGGGHERRKGTGNRLLSRHWGVSHGRQHAHGPARVRLALAVGDPNPLLRPLVSKHAAWDGKGRRGQGAASASGGALTIIARALSIGRRRCCAQRATNACDHSSAHMVGTTQETCARGRVQQPRSHLPHADLPLPSMSPL